jgi:hypothetical protein
MCERSTCRDKGSGSIAADEDERATLGTFATKGISGALWPPVAISTVTRIPIDAAARPQAIAPALVRTPLLPLSGREYPTSRMATVRAPERCVAL